MVWRKFYKKNLVIIVFIVLILVLGTGLLVYKRNQPVKIVPLPNEKTYTQEDIAPYNVPNACWTAVGSYTYNITAYVATHKDKPDLSYLCGLVADDIFKGNIKLTKKPDFGFKASVSSAQKALALFRIGSFKLLKPPPGNMTLEQAAKLVKEGKLKPAN